ncbi:MAG TPA: Ig-like domain-containing protein [Longimicrobiaceae bacterium]|nr:Ig-like domain-containing protein [Longimicrobiaceae bacterium]
MRSPLLALAALSILLPGCLDTGTDPPETRVATIRLSQSTVALDDGATVRLTAEALDRGGRVLPAGAVRVAWSSSDEAVATVADGLVTGRRPGEARITATVRRVSASADATVRAVPRQLAPVSGAAQQGTAGMPAPQELAVLVTDRHGDGVSDAAVEFVVVRGEGSVAPASTLTDAQGRARAVWTLGAAAGENAVEARLAGGSLAPAVFVATGNAGPPTRLVKLSGDVQEGAAATQLPLPLVVKVSDAHGNPVAGASVAWRPTHGGSVAPSVSVSDAAGEARATWLLGPGAGEQAVEAWVEGSPARAQFVARAGAGAAARLEKVSGDRQEATVTQPLAEPLVVRVVDAPGNAVPGVKVSWTLGYGGGSVAPGESVTDAQGHARATWTLGTIMATHRLEVRAVEPALAPVVFTARALVGPPARVAKHIGDGQQGQAGGTLPGMVVVRVSDEHGNPVPAVPVAWATSDGGRVEPAQVQTDTLGLARTTWTLGTRAGPQTMSATALGQTLTFGATATLGPTASISVSPDAIGLPLGEMRQLRATVTDLFGNEGEPAPGALAWASSDPAVATVSASGSVTAISRGSATITATRDGVTGSARVTAQLAGLYLGTLGGADGAAHGINDAGHVVGWSTTVGSGEQRAFLWKDGVMTNLGTLGGPHSVAYAINNAGQVVGESLNGSGQMRAFLWQNGVMTDLGTLGGPGSRAYAINDAGQVVGSSNPPGGGLHPFLWQNGVMTDLGTLGGSISAAHGINGAGWIVGTSGTGAGHHAFLWQDGVMTDLGALGGVASSARAINEAGQVVGFTITASGETRAFIWKDGAATDLGSLGGPPTQATDIDQAGRVVGESRSGSGQQRAFVWSDGVMSDLHPLESSIAHGINNVGQAVGMSWTRGPRSEVIYRAMLWTLR